jgi:uncharacterized protein YfdQ (DUF2303 family)
VSNNNPIQEVAKPVLFNIDDEHQFIALPPDTTVQNLKGFLPPPKRIQQSIETLSVPAFLAYLVRYAGNDSVIFASEGAAEYEAVLDYHPKRIDHASDRGECDHIVNYRCPKSEQWKTWNDNSTKMVSQVDFATFVENNLRDIIEPVGADMLQLALQLQIHKSAEFDSGIRLDTGQVQFRYIETIKGSSNTKAGDLEIPKGFKLKLPVFVDGAQFVQEARFKYRMDGGKLSLGYELIRPLETFSAAVKQVTDEIVKGAKDIPLYQGKRQ